MGPLLVEGGDELIETRLLLQEVLGGRLGGLLLERQMHALMAAVLLRVARLDAFDVDPQPQPPHRQAGEAEEGVGAGKGSSVIGANRCRQAEVLKSPFKYGKSVQRLSVGEGLTADQVTAGEVWDGDW